MTQTALDGHETPLGVKLGPRQQSVFDTLAERTLTDDECGALIHSWQGKHDADERCEWDAQVGRQVLVSLRRHKLVVRRHGGQWERRDVRPAPEQVVPHDPSTAEIPF